MSEISFVLLDQEEACVQYAFGLRNLPSVRKISLHQEEKEYSSFKNEYINNWFSERSLPPVALLREKKYCGLLYFKRAADPTERGLETIDVSIIIDEPFQGKGIGKQALRKALRWIKEQGFSQIIAKILPFNDRSKRTFSSVGFQFFDVYSEELFDTGQHIACERWLYSEQKHPLFPQVFIVAECGSNWKAGSKDEDKSRAFALVDAAKNAGCDGVKFQSFQPQNLYAPGAGEAEYLQKKGIRKTMNELFDELVMPEDLFLEIVSYTKKQGLHFLCTPFSEQDFARVDPHVEFHKIASYELSHLRLLELAALSNKPLFLSTGGATEEEVSFSVQYYRKCGGKKLVLLQCTAAYPAPDESVNLAAISWMRRRYTVDTGLSDHTMDPIIAPVGAVALGAQVIEKHITLDRSFEGPDHSYAILPEELKSMVQAIRKAEFMRGDEFKCPQKVEKELVEFALRSLQAIEDISVGDPFVEGKNISILRSGNQVKGVHPHFLPLIEGKPAKRAIAKGVGVQHGDW